MKTNKFQGNIVLRGLWNGDRQQQRHFFGRALKMGFVTTRGEQPMKLSELAFLTFCRALGDHTTTQMENFASEQDHAPYFDKSGVNFLYYWEHILKNGPIGVDRIEFNQSGRFVTVFEKTSEGIKGRTFQNTKSTRSKYGSAMFVIPQMALAHLHSAVLSSGSNDEARQLKDEELKALLS